jgi:hypothetical protein
LNKSDNWLLVLIGKEIGIERLFRVNYLVRLTTIAYSGAKLPPIPDESCHPFHSKAATDSGECCHPQVVMF